VVVADGGDPNTDGDLENEGDVADVSVYVEEVTAVSGQQIRGVFEVGGDIEGSGGACDGFAFVRLTADPLSTLASQIAAGLGLIALLALIAIAMRRTRVAEVVPEVGTMGGPETSQGELIPEDGAADSGQTDVETPSDQGWLGGATPGGEDSSTDEPAPGGTKDDEDFPPTT
jgi:hypothetical protein